MESLEKEKLIRFDISGLKLCKLLDESTALLDVRVCTSGNNAHNLPFTKDTLRNAAERTLRGKPIVAEYSHWRRDIGTHERPENSNRIGYFVENQDFRYVDNEDGTCSLYAYAILWKDYAPNEYQCIVDGEDSTKGVSMEIKWNSKKQGFQGDMELEEITDFSFRAVAILGDRYIPASAGSNAKVVVFSDRVKETEMKYFSEKTIKIENSKESANNSKSWSNPGRKLYSKILKATNSESLVKEAYLVVEDGYKDSPSSKLKYPHHVVKGDKLVVDISGLKAAFSRAEQQGIVNGEIKDHLMRHYKEIGLDTENFSEKEESSLEENKDKVMMEENNPEDTKEDKKEEKFEETPAAVEDKKDDIDDDDDEDEKHEENYAEKMKEYECKMAENEKKIVQYEAELEELRKYKADREESDKNFAIEQTISEVIDIMPKDEIDKFREEGKSISFAEVDGFKNKIKARALDFAVENSGGYENRMAVNNQDVGKTKPRFW